MTKRTIPVYEENVYTVNGKTLFKIDSDYNVQPLYGFIIPLSKNSRAKLLELAYEIDEDDVSSMSKPELIHLVNKYVLLPPNYQVVQHRQQQTVRDCAAGKIRNPATRRCVKVNGRIGKRITKTNKG